jgi:putative iron-regulated protein
MIKYIKILTIIIIILIVVKVIQKKSEKTYDASKQIKSYTHIVHNTYLKIYEDALIFEQSVNDFLALPSKKLLKNTQEKWLNLSNSLNKAEGFRFYNSPVDFVLESSKERSLNDKIANWPIKYEYIDYTKDNTKSGIIQDKTTKITKDFLQNSHLENGNSTTGIHVIEFLLWGEDLKKSKSGNRSYTDYVSGNFFNDKRRDFLKLSTEILVEDLKILTDSWNNQGTANYYNQFIKLDQKKALGKIAGGMIKALTLQLANKMIITSINSQNKEYEKSAFSDNTSDDFINIFLSIKNVYFATYDSFKGSSFHDLIKSKSPSLAQKIVNKISEIELTLKEIPKPYDKVVLQSVENSVERNKMLALATNLKELSSYLSEASKDIGIEVK